MELGTAIGLIEKGVLKKAPRQAWADLGAGRGLFTNALATLLSTGSTLYAIDKDRASLDAIKFSSSDIILKKIQIDFTHEELKVEQLDGILMANSLHFVRDKTSFMLQLKKLLKENGRIILVEYESATPNQWVPYPVRYAALQKFARDAGFPSVTKIGEEPSRYHQANMYAAVLTL